MKFDYERVINYIRRCSHIHDYAKQADAKELSSVWSVGRDVDYDCYEDMSELQENIGNVRLSRFLKELEKEIWIAEMDRTISFNEPKECFLEIFEPDIPEGYFTTCDIKTRCSECKTQIFGLQQGQKYCQFCGAKIKR